MLNKGTREELLTWLANDDVCVSTIARCAPFYAHKLAHALPAHLRETAFWQTS